MNRMAPTLIGPGICSYCREPIEETYVPPNGADQAYCDGYPAHNECGLRSALGGIGHLTNHEHWCIEEGDPDAGHSYRESGVLVWNWVREYGIDAAVKKG